MTRDGFEWDPAKASANLLKHGVSFADAALSVQDPRALTVADPDAIGEERFVTLGLAPTGHVLVVVFSHVPDGIRIISARKASPGERRTYEDD
jgi:uncharacterized protein